MDNNNQQDFNRFYSDISGMSGQNQSSSFDIVFWILKILKYWYLFVIALIIAGGLAYLKNKAWTPTYKTTSTILIEESRKNLSDVGTGYNYSGSQNQRGINNQMIMFSAYDLIAKSVDKLNISTEIYEKHRFKNIDLYGAAPVKIDGNYVAANAYGLEFYIKGVSDSTFQIGFDGNENISTFKIKGEYGKSIQHSLFFILVEKTDFFQNVTPYNLYFHFVSKEQQIGDYTGRLQSKFIMEGSSVMEVSLTGKVARRDLDFMSKLNQEFFNDNLARKNASTQKAIDFIDEQLMIIKDSISSSESKLNSYQLKSGIYSQDQSMRTSVELNDLGQKRDATRLKKEYANFLAEIIRKENSQLVLPSTMGIQDPALTALVEQYNVVISSMKTLGPESPIYKRYKLELDDKRKLINEAISSMNTSIRMEDSNLTQRYNKLMAEVESLPEKERKLLTHERDFKINDSYNTYLLQRRIESKIQMASNSPDNVILDKPRVVAITNLQDRTSTYIFYLAVGLLIPLIFVVCKEFLFKFAVQSRDEVERISGLPILGTIERASQKEQVVVKVYPRSSFTEGFRNLRSRMEYVTGKGSPITMLVTSTEPKDGKTFIACNLASVYEIMGKKTIIVDFDLRRPALSKAMGMEHNKGVSNYLIGQVELSDVIITSTDYGFDILPAGTIPPNPSELLRSPKTQTIYDELKKKYDYIILDCSPAGLVSDAYSLGKMSDIILYVVRNEKTNRNFFKYTVAELKEDKENNIAIIYNDVNLKSGYYGYGGKNYYGRSSYYVKHDSYYRDDEAAE